MEPLSAALIAAFAAAAGSLGQGIADGVLQAPGGDAWAGLVNALRDERAAIAALEQRLAATGGAQQG